MNSKLSDYERLVLMNQHKILEKLSDDEEEKKSHESMVTVYQSGYEDEYELDYIYEPLDEEECIFTRELIAMYDSLYIYWKKDENIQSEIDELKVKFSGFDLNDNVESKFYNYADFLIRDKNLFHEVRDSVRKDPDSLNSHGFGPGLDRYKNILKKYKEIRGVKLDNSDYSLSVDDFKNILY